MIWDSSKEYLKKCPVQKTFQSYIQVTFQQQLSNTIMSESPPTLDARFYNRNGKSGLRMFNRRRPYPPQRVPQQQIVNAVQQVIGNMSNRSQSRPRTQYQRRSVSRPRGQSNGRSRSRGRRQSIGYRMPVRKPRLNFPRYKRGFTGDLMRLLAVNNIDMTDLGKNPKNYDLLAKMKGVLSTEQGKIKIPEDSARRFIKYVIMLVIIDMKDGLDHAGENKEDSGPLSSDDVRGIKDKLKEYVKSEKLLYKRYNAPPKVIKEKDFYRLMDTNKFNKEKKAFENHASVRIQVSWSDLKKMRGYSVKSLKTEDGQWPEGWVKPANKTDLGAPYSDGHPVGMSVSMHRKSFNFEDSEFD